VVSDNLVTPRLQLGVGFQPTPTELVATKPVAAFAGLLVHSHPKSHEGGSNMARSASFQAMRTSIAKSNRSASRNRNLYPIQEQATLMEIWDYVPCECDSSCTCRRLGCKRHWKLGEDLTSAEVGPAFLRMFVDKGRHEKLRGWVSGRLSIPDLAPPRVQGALDVLRDIRENWDELYAEALSHNKTLVCDDWQTEFWRNQWTFHVQRTSVYKAVLYTIAGYRCSLRY